MYWSDVVGWQFEGTVDTVMLPSPAGTLPTLNAPLAEVCTAGSDVAPVGVTVTVAFAMAPPSELDTVPDTVPPAFFGPEGMLQAARHNTIPAIVARVFTFHLSVVWLLSFDLLR